MAFFLIYPKSDPVLGVLVACSNFLIVLEFISNFVSLGFVLAISRVAIVSFIVSTLDYALENLTPEIICGLWASSGLFHHSIYANERTFHFLKLCLLKLPFLLYLQDKHTNTLGRNFLDHSKSQHMQYRHTLQDFRLLSLRVLVFIAVNPNSIYFCFFSIESSNAVLHHF